MLTTDPHDALVVAHDRARELRAEAATERLVASPRARQVLAAYLRRAADRLDRASLVRAPASQS